MALDKQNRPQGQPSRTDGQDRGLGTLLDRKTQRRLAKAGVLAALGVLVWTGMQRPRRRYMPLHTWTGMALIGLTLWHWSLYLPRPEKRSPAQGPASKSGARAVPPAQTTGD